MSRQKVGVNLGIAHTVAEAVLGQIHEDASGNHYMYLQADGAVTGGTLYVYDHASGQIEDQADVTNYPADADSMPICISPVTLADNEYVWAFVGPGQATCLTDATGVATANDICYVSATAGCVSSGVTAALLKGVSVDTAITGGASGTIRAANRMFSEDLPS